MCNLLYFYLELLKLIGKEWENADENVKIELETSYRKELDHYSTEKLEYTRKLSAEQLTAIQNAKAQMFLASNKRKLKKVKEII